MQRFAFIVHPLVARDFAKKFSLVKHLPESCLEGILRYIPSFKVSHITGIKSVHAEAEGWFIGCPLTARQMLELPEEIVLDKLREYMSEEFDVDIGNLPAKFLLDFIIETLGSPLYNQVIDDILSRR